MRQRQISLEGIKEAVSKLPDFLVFVGAALLVVDEFFRRIFSLPLLPTTESDSRVVLIIAILVLFAFTIVRKLDRVERLVQQSSDRFLGIIDVLPSQHELDFASIVRSCRTVRILTLSGTKTGNLADTSVREALRDTHRRSSVTILLADPRSEAIITRYRDDEPANYEAGIEGITRRLHDLYAIWKGLPEDLKNRTEIRVFKCYPTMSLVQADHDVYSSSYAYKLRGNDCPKLHASSSGNYGNFLLRHFEEIYASSTPLETWVNAVPQA